MFTAAANLFAYQAGQAAHPPIPERWPHPSFVFTDSWKKKLPPYPGFKMPHPGLDYTPGAGVPPPPGYLGPNPNTGPLSPVHFFDWAALEWFIDGVRLLQHGFDTDLFRSRLQRCEYRVQSEVL